jgi:uncharacterized protein (TIGR02996 family)
MPSPGHEPFLRAICGAPDDDAPRLVYADWLHENGDPDRAEFIRLQVRFAREPLPSVERRCRDLFLARAWDWVSALPGTIRLWGEFTVMDRIRQRGNRIRSVSEPGALETWHERETALADWERGFPVAVYVQGESNLFFAHVNEIREFVPVHRLRLIDLPDPDGFIRALAGNPFLSKLRKLVLSAVWLSDDVVVALAESPFAAGLRELSMMADHLTDRSGLALAASPHLGGIEMLHLVHNQFSESVASALRARFGFRVHC